MKREPGMAYNTKTLNKVFAVIAIIFLLTTIWVALDDFIRPWKAVQVKGFEIRKEVLKSQVELFDQNLDQTKVQQVIAAIKDGDRLINERQSKLEKINEDLAEVRAKLYAQKLINGVFNANASETQYKYETAAHYGDNKAKSLKKKLDKILVDFGKSKDKIKAFQSREKKLKAEAAALHKEKSNAEREREKLLGARDRLLASVERADFFSNPVNFIRNAPFLDFLDPTIKIHQVVLDNYVDDRYFRKIYKVDRCMTCHMFSDQEGYENQENPYKTHPKLDLMVGANSPHPVKQMGCTNCHGGEGHRVTDFNSAAHMPQNDEQKAEWVKKYDWHAPHKVPREMYPLQHTESQCIKCHSNTEWIPEGTVVNEGKQLIEDYGCYACHKIEGWEGERMAGPSLQKVASKLDKTWVKNWIWNPQLFNEHSKMPRFFEQSNNSEPRFVKKNIAEVNAMAEYLWDKSKDYKPIFKYSQGNAEKGKELVQTIGCLGCHQADEVDENYAKAKNRAGPYLQNLGSKLDPDWLVTWLIKPSHYDSETIMPSLRLTRAEANDITAYLLNSRNKTFEKLEFAPLDGKLRDEILVEYFSAFDTIEVAKAKLGKMSEQERTLELGRRSIGKYGCYSCHDMVGFDEFPPIGPELSKIGTKPLTQFGFGHQDVEHTRQGWIKAHLINPRRWDIGVVKPFKDLTRMPNFYMTDNEAETITTYLLGLVEEYIPMKGLDLLESHEGMARAGEKVINKYNCMGCHQINNIGGEILKNYEDINEGPPRLVDHGERVQSDWLNNFLKNVHPIRPYLESRMPNFNFSEEERNAIVAYFQHKSKQYAFIEREPVKWEAGEESAAKQLWENLACVSCHSGGFTNDEPLAPNLKLGKRKLRSEWIEKWLAGPQSILPGTVMPNFWEDGESQEPDILGGDPEKQIRALRKLIYSFGYDDFPKPYDYIK